jgi:hypothetical protein
MSYLLAAPDVVGSAASDLAGIGSALNSAHSAAVLTTTAVVAAAGDEVSAAIAEVFSGHGLALSIVERSGSGVSSAVRGVDERGG